MLETDLQLKDFVRPDAEIDWSDPSLPRSPIRNITPGLKANAEYFGHPEWAQGYLKYCHRNKRFHARWRRAAGSWDDKIVVDVGCGPGNVYANMGGKPKLLIGIDVSEGGLRMAQDVGYTTIMGDAQEMPFVSHFADIVVLNAALHHCDDMEKVLMESARLVKPGGIMVIDHDPQISSIDFRGLAKGLWYFRLFVNLMLQKGFHRSRAEQSLVLATEIHHDPGEGVSEEFFLDNLKPLGFKVDLYPHNNNGEEALDGDMGEVPRRFRILQRLSGVNPSSKAGAIILMCVATLPDSNA
ncbi:class I SAM-dependent methyltransferase [bacterium]|nr:MAG: class I SAM-dependent methyltransferase [bacterium]